MKKSAKGNFEQCYERGEIEKRAFPRTRTCRLMLKSKGQPTGIVQGTHSAYFGFGMTLRVRNGPVVNCDNHTNLEQNEILLRALEEHAKGKHVIEAELWIPTSWQLTPLVQKLGYSLTSRINEYIVDLRNNEDELWRNIARNKRKNIRRALKEGVEITHSSSSSDLIRFYSMLRSTARRAGFPILPLSWFEAVWSLYGTQHSRIFFAHWNGEAISSVFVVTHGKTVYAEAAASLKAGWRVRPNDTMHWEVMQWARKNDFSNYYMGLVPEPVPTQSSGSWGIWRWKREWKGFLRRIAIFRKTYLPKYSIILRIKGLAEKGLQVL